MERVWLSAPLQLYFAVRAHLVLLARAGQGRAGQGWAGQGRAGQGRAGQGKSGTYMLDVAELITLTGTGKTFTY